MAGVDRRGGLLAMAAIAWLLSLAASASSGTSRPQSPPWASPGPLFDTSHNCMACHNGLTTTAGEDISLGVSWRATMMANSARDPYWQASVRREILDHPAEAAEIEHECSVCHMPMSHTQQVAEGRTGTIFEHLPAGAGTTPEAALAADGVSCTACHQITSDRLGRPESFTGGYVIDPRPGGSRRIFGPYAVNPGRTRLMHSATGFVPVESPHVRQSELCATCHTLYTRPRGPDGTELGAFPEQVPYLEWRHSAYRDERSCQSCHMPVVTEPTRMASVLGELRDGIARHTFRGGNFFMLRMLNRYRNDLGVEALPQELEASARDTLEHLRTESAVVRISRAERAGDGILVDVVVENLSGHKLPTAYPSRRAWLHLTVRDRSGTVVFESGAVTADGRIVGNDNDDDPAKAEPHHLEIGRPGDVQIYESIMADAGGRITTGLLKAVTYVKDNRLLPRGFDKSTAPPDVAVQGAAREDPDFASPGDATRYRIALGRSEGPFRIEVELLYQPIGFRWADNLRGYDAPEPARFVNYYRSMSAASSAVLGRADARVD